MEALQLEGVNNARDLGGIPLVDGRKVVPGLLYRGSALSDATESDCKRLSEKLGIRCIVDLRCGWEVEEAPDVDVPGAEYLHIPFYDKEKVGIEYTQSAEETKVVGRDVACEPDDFYRSLANPLTVGQMRKGLQAVFDHALKGEAVYVHCSGGKDRAGIMALLILTVLGASREAILEDYLFTNVSRDARYDQMLARFLRFTNGDKERAHELVLSHRALPENLDAFYEAIEQSYGSMDSFVQNQLEINDTRRDEIRAACTVLS